MTPRPLVLTHLYKCAGSSVRRMLFHKFQSVFPVNRMHVPQLTADEYANLPMMHKRGEELPRGLLLLADHTPSGLFDSLVLAPGRPFRLTLLREPIDRFESYFHFCARHGFIPEKWSSYRHELSAMPRSTFVDWCKEYDATAGYTFWLDPRSRSLRSALANLLAYDVVARHDDLPGFCRAFNERNPYGLRFDGDEILHVNHASRPSRMSEEQVTIVREELREDVAVWTSQAVQDAMQHG